MTMIVRMAQCRSLLYQAEHQVRLFILDSGNMEEVLVPLAYAQQQHLAVLVLDWVRLLTTILVALQVTVFRIMLLLWVLLLHIH